MLLALINVQERELAQMESVSVARLHQVQIVLKVFAILIVQAEEHAYKIL